MWESRIKILMNQKECGRKTKSGSLRSCFYKYMMKGNGGYGNKKYSD